MTGCLDSFRTKDSRLLLRYLGHKPFMSFFHTPV
jgi:hypothetical protein